MNEPTDELPLEIAIQGHFYAQLHTAELVYTVYRPNRLVTRWALRIIRYGGERVALHTAKDFTGILRHCAHYGIPVDDGWIGKGSTHGPTTSSY